MIASSNGFESILNQVPRLVDRTLVTELSGGLTNRNLKITTASGDYVARISSNKSALLAIDRKSEYENSKIAAQVGVGAPVYDFLPTAGLLLLGFLPGKTYTNDDVANNLTRVASSVRQLHNGPKFVSEFDMFVIQQHYLKIVTEQGFRMPENYLEYLKPLELMKDAINVINLPKVACNNDLLAANFIDDGEKIWIIDYEYSGNNDPCFELGNIYSESNLTYQQLIELVDAYFGSHRPEMIARAWLFALLARYGWTLWAAIQDGISELDFDFWEWGMQKYQQAKIDFASDQFNTALRQVKIPTQPI
jgi:thiamine kinase-like enzyme